MSAFLTVPAAVKFLEEHNWPEVARKCREAVVYTRNQFLDYLNITPLCPDHWLGQMASIPLPILDADACKKKLLETYRIQVPVFEWENKTYLRYSIQAYNSEDELEKLLKISRVQFTISQESGHCYIIFRCNCFQKETYGYIPNPSSGI